jgi:hypothetical protein
MGSQGSKEISSQVPFRPAKRVCCPKLNSNAWPKSTRGRVVRESDEREHKARVSK